MSYLKSFIKSSIIAMLIALVLMIILGGALYTRVEGTEVDLSKLDIKPTPTIIYDKNGEVIAKFREEKKDVTAYEEIPVEVMQALTSTEDRAFYEHAGINVKAIFRAGAAVLKSGGDYVQGGSTITQQLVKQIYLTDEKSIDRKIKEAVIATELESEMSKNEIIKNYLNHVYYGNGAYGIRKAIETYYGMTLEDFKALSKEERIVRAALLGGIVQLPSENDPYSNPDGAKKRTAVVLGNMKSMGYITEEEYQKAKEQGLQILDKPNIKHDDQLINNGEITSYVLSEASESLNLTQEQVRFGGYEIYTSFDPKAYQAIRQNFEKNSLNATSDSEVSASIVNPKTGEILALSGGRKAPGYTEYNRAYQGKKQPGSSMKPIIVYAPALESGKFTPWSSLVNQKGTTFELGYKPKNSNGGGSGKISMIDAIKHSQNIAAVYTLDKVGINYATDFVEKLGIRLSESDRYLPIALGGLSEGVNTLELTDAYQGFANGGHRVEAHIIKRVVDNQGDNIFEPNTKLSEDNRVMKKSTAEYMENMLQNAVISGTGQNAKIEGELVGGKTGTTDSQNNIWFSGFTSEFVMTVWMGYDQEKALPVGSYVAANMFSKIGTDLAKYYPDGDRKYEPLKKKDDDMKSISVSVDLDEKNKKLKLSWSKEKETEYTVYKDGKEVKTGISRGEFSDSKLEEGTTYIYTVVGYNKYTDIETHKSGEIEVRIEKEKEKPSSPSFGTPSVTGDSIRLNWSEVTDAESYILTRNGKVIFEGARTSFTDSELEPLTTYHYELVAVNGSGKSPVSKINATTSKGANVTNEDDLDEETKAEIDEINKEETGETDKTPTTPTNPTTPTEPEETDEVDDVVEPTNPTPTTPTNPTNPTPNQPTNPTTNQPEKETTTQG